MKKTKRGGAIVEETNLKTVKSVVNSDSPYLSDPHLTLPAPHTDGSPKPRFCLTTHNIPNIVNTLYNFENKYAEVW